MSINENDNDNDNDNDNEACPLFSLKSTDHQGGELQDCEINILIE